MEEPIKPVSPQRRDPKTWTTSSPTGAVDEAFLAISPGETGEPVHRHVRPDGGAGVAGAARGAGRHGEPRRGLHEFEFTCQMGMIRGKLVVEEEGPDHD